MYNQSLGPLFLILCTIPTPPSLTLPKTSSLGCGLHDLILNPACLSGLLGLCTLVWNTHLSTFSARAFQRHHIGLSQGTELVRGLAWVSWISVPSRYTFSQCCGFFFVGKSIPQSEGPEPFVLQCPLCTVGMRPFPCDPPGCPALPQLGCASSFLSPLCLDGSGHLSCLSLLSHVLEIRAFLLFLSSVLYATLVYKCLWHLMAPLFDVNPPACLL